MWDGNPTVTTVCFTSACSSFSTKVPGTTRCRALLDQDCDLQYREPVSATYSYALNSVGFKPEPSSMFLVTLICVRFYPVIAVQIQLLFRSFIWPFQQAEPNYTARSGRALYDAATCTAGG